MDTKEKVQLTIPKCVLTSFSPALMISSHMSLTRAITYLTAVNAELERFNKCAKERLIKYELEKPFFQALFDCYGRGF